jgi:hypothetical protein
VCARKPLLLPFLVRIYYIWCNWQGYCCTMHAYNVRPIVSNVWSNLDMVWHLSNLQQKVIIHTVILLLSWASPWIWFRVVGGFDLITFGIVVRGDCFRFCYRNKNGLGCWNLSIPPLMYTAIALFCIDSNRRYLMTFIHAGSWACQSQAWQRTNISYYIR